MMLVGLVLSFLEPVLHSLLHGHGIGMESIGEGVGGLLMTFVEGLANLFSFLRIAAFALAHASLGVAAEALNRSPRNHRNRFSNYERNSFELRVRFEFSTVTKAAIL